MIIIKRYEINRSLETEKALRDYIGKTFESNSSGRFKVLGAYDRYFNSNNNKLRFVIQFLDTGFQTIAFGNRIKSGGVRDYMVKNICGIGYIGELSFEDEPSKHFLYKHWIGMINRNYNIKSKQYREGGTVEEKWHCFKNFISDFENGKIFGSTDYIQNSDIKWALDKDFIEEGNKIYSVEKCCFLPSKINSFISENITGKEYEHEGFWIDGDVFATQVKHNKKLIGSASFKSPVPCVEMFYDLKQEVANEMFKNEFKNLSTQLKNIVYNKIEQRREKSLYETNRAISDGVFDDIFRSQNIVKVKQSRYKNIKEIKNNTRINSKNKSKTPSSYKNKFYEVYCFISEVKELLRNLEALEYKLNTKDKELKEIIMPKIISLRELLKNKDQYAIESYEFILNEKLGGLGNTSDFSKIFEDFKNINDEILFK